MLVVRKAFSSSFASSDTSGAETGTGSMPALLRKAQARSVACSDKPAHEARNLEHGGIGIADPQALRHVRHLDIRKVQPALCKPPRRAGLERALDDDQLAGQAVGVQRLGNSLQRVVTEVSVAVALQSDRNHDHFRGG